MMNETERTSFTLLGDGDFSFSADVAAFCRQQEPRRAIIMYATGLDPATTLATKYKNSSFLINQLKSDDQLEIQVHHGINAVQPDPIRFRADHVIFNHPHLATEDAQLHSRFIAHFFHASATGWMASEGGLVHLSLAKGQCERWHCLQMAQRQGLVLLERNPFSLPSVKEPQFQHRRHQTGKSFSRRTEGSETLTFARKGEASMLKATCLPWQHLQLNQHNNANRYPCHECGKVFLEDRARTSHTKAVHGGSKKRKRALLACAYCTERTFPHQDALQDHMQAKHYSVHSKILPDWAAGTEQDGGLKSQECQTCGECSICGLVYFSPSDEEAHINTFVPHDSHVQDNKRHTSQCSFCSKQFTDRRAQLQHENFCASKNGIKFGTTESKIIAIPSSY